MLSVLERPFFSLAVIRAALPDLLAAFAEVPSLSVVARDTELAFPEQPYRAEPHHRPMILWTPECSPELTAFMPQIGSGDYFVLSHAATKFGFSAASARSTLQADEWPINEFITYSGGKRQRIVRAMRDSPRWDFYADGDPLAFEDMDQYMSRKVRDRFQRESLVTYMERWGAPVGQPGFWKSQQPASTFVRRDTKGA